MRKIFISVSISPLNVIQSQGLKWVYCGEVDQIHLALSRMLGNDTSSLPKERYCLGWDATLGIELIWISTFLLSVAQSRKHRALMRVKLTNVLVHMHKYVYGVLHVKTNSRHLQPWWGGQVNRYLPWPSPTEMGCDTRSSITWGTKHIQPGQKFPSPHRH